MSDSVYQNFQFSTPFLKGYRQLRIPVVDDVGNPVWDALFSLKKIEELREIVGPRYFSSQMMLEYINEEKVCLDPGALHFYLFDFDVRGAKLGDNAITGASVYWDPSGGRTSGDSSVCVLVYRDDKNRRAFIHDIRYLVVNDRDIYPLATQCQTVLEFMQLHGQKRIAIEVNGIGNALPEILLNIASRQNIPVIVKKVVNHIGKKTRILDAIEPLLTTGRLFAHERIKSTPLLSEMLGWIPMVANQNDDGLDAIAGALRLQPMPMRGASQLPRMLTAKTDFKL